MASAIGRPIKVDTNTLKFERGKFARVCVEVDLTAPVVGKIWVNGHWYKVQYEGLHLISSSYGCYGHLGRNCPRAAANTGKVHLNHQETANQQPTTTMPPQLVLAANNNNGNVSIPNHNDLSTINDKLISNDEGINELHGDWLLVTRRKKTATNPSFNAHKNVTHRANKFSALSNLAPQNRPNPTTQKFPQRPTPIDASRGRSAPIQKRQRQEESTQSPIIKQSLTNQKVKPPMKPSIDQQDLTAIIVTPSNANHINSHVKDSFDSKFNHATQIMAPHTHEVQINHNPNHENNFENAINLSNSTSSLTKDSETEANISRIEEESMISHDMNGDTEINTTSSNENHEPPSQSDEDMVT